VTTVYEFGMSIPPFCLNQRESDKTSSPNLSHQETLKGFSLTQSFLDPPWPLTTTAPPLLRVSRITVLDRDLGSLMRALQLDEFAERQPCCLRNLMNFHKRFVCRQSPAALTLNLYVGDKSI
jgi:hypothetical protein